VFTGKKRVGAERAEKKGDFYLFVFFLYWILVLVLTLFLF